MKNYAHWKTPITNLLKLYAAEAEPARYLGLYISAKAVELTHAEAVDMLKWFPNLRNDLVHTTKQIATKTASTAMKLNHISDEIMLDCFSQLIKFHNTSGMTFYTLNTFRKTVHQTSFSLSNKKSFDEVFENLINESHLSKNIHIRATSIESMTKMASLDKLNSTQLLRAFNEFFINREHYNKFIKEYAKEGLNMVIYKGRGTDAVTDLKKGIDRFGDCTSFSKHDNALNNVSVYTKEFITKYIDDVFSRIKNKPLFVDDAIINAYDGVYMCTSEGDAVLVLDIFKDKLKNSSFNEDLYPAIAASQSMGKMTAMVPENMLLEPLSIILKKDYYHASTMLALRDEVMKIVDGIKDTNHINEVVDLCVNATIQHKNIHGRATGLGCIQEMLIFHKLSTTTIEHIFSSKFYAHKDELIDNRISSGETFVLLIKKALELGMEDYIEEIFDWSPKNGGIGDPLEVLNLIGWEENVRQAIDMDYYKERHMSQCLAKESRVYECPAEDCYSENAESYCFAHDDLI